MTRADVLEQLNTEIRAEKGNRVTEDSMFTDAGLDSFGTTLVFLALDNTYGYFDKCGYKEDQFKQIPYSTLTVKEIVDVCISETINI